jgi:actin-like ATPase involved in cell morphogenesis
MAMKLLGELAETKPDNHDSVLLRKGDGVIDGLNKLSQILTRVTAKERQSAEETESAPAGTPVDERELERRIIAEIDRRAAARGADRPVSGGHSQP